MALTLKALRRQNGYDLLQANGYDVQSNRLMSHELDKTLQLALNEIARLTDKDVREVYRVMRSRVACLKPRDNDKASQGRVFRMHEGTLYASETKTSDQFQDEVRDLTSYEYRTKQSQNPEDPQV
jgi:hypothetical protein